MALQGTLRDFGIADIFQLIAHQQKTGILQLRREGDPSGLDVHFVGGLVAASVPGGEPAGGRLAEHLVRAGTLTPERLQQAKDQAQQELAKLRDVLVDGGYVDNETVCAVERLFALESIYELFGWQDGHFQFVQQGIEADSDSFQPISAEHILMEGFRMVDEWPSIRKTVPDSTAKIQRLSAPKPAPKAAGGKKKAAQSAVDDIFADLKDDDEGGDDGLSGEESKVLGIAETGRTVQWVIDRSRLGAFEASKAVASLVTKGYLKLDIVGGQMEAAASFFEGGEVTRRSPFPLLAGATVLAAVVFLLGRRSLVQSFAWPFRVAGQIRQIQANQRLQQVRQALDVYHLLKGSYPEALEALERENILPSGFFASGGSPPYVYGLKAEGAEGPPYSLEALPPGS